MNDSALVTIELVSPSLNPFLALQVGSSFDERVLDEDEGVDARISRILAAGRYTIRTSPWGGVTGPFTLTVTVAPEPGLTSEQYDRYRETWQESTDDPIVPGVTAVAASHFIELRTRIDAARAAAGLPAYGWTDGALTAGATPVRLVHLLELRAALAAAYAATGRAAPRWTDAAPAAGTTTIRAAHLIELRAAVMALE